MCNISVSESSLCTREISGQLADFPAEITEKLSKTSYENKKKWHTDVDKQDPSAISCKVPQTQYLCLKLQF